MFQKCPSCKHSFDIEVMSIIDEEVVSCPRCSHHYKIYLDPKTKQILEKSHQEIMGYMLLGSHETASLVNNLPSGVMNTYK